MTDLCTAIDLSSNAEKYKKTLCLALTQRGILNRFLGKIRNDSIDYIRLFYIMLLFR